MTFKTYDEMDVSHRLAYKMGREDAVANPNIEAAAEVKVWERFIAGDGHPGTRQRDTIDIATEMIAAALTPPGDE